MFTSLSPTRSLSSKLILFTLFFLCASMIVLTLINNQMTRTNLFQMAQSQIDGRVKSTVDRIDLYLSERESDAQVLGSLLTVRTLLEKGDSPETMQELSARLDTAIDAYGYDVISILDPKGRIVVSTDTTLDNQLQDQRPEVIAAIQGDIAFSEVRAESGIGYFYITAPVFNLEGDVIGAIDLRANLDVINDILNSDTDGTGEGSYSILLDEHLVRIAIPTSQESLFRPVVPLTPAVRQAMIDDQRFDTQTATLLDQATDAQYVYEAAQTLRTNIDQEQVFYQGVAGANNVESIGVMRRISHMPWLLQHRVPIQSFTQVVDQQFWNALLVTFGAAVLCIVAVILFATYTLNRPLARLVQAAQSLEEGNLSQRLTVNGRDEIGKLASSFNAMADALETRIAAEKDARAEAQLLQQTEFDSRQTLEQTVTSYLSFVQQVARGDLSHRISIEQNGALGQLGQGLNGMVESLQLLTSQVQQASANIAAAAAEILAATTQQASSASEQSAAITQTTTTIEEVRAIALQTAQQAAQVAQDSQTALTVAREGSQSVEATVTGMNQIGQQVESIAQTILALSEQTQAIGTIIATVSEIADQSNLLALNAAIEAARAGEQGKSFAVVAQHVRDLAERSKNATVQVRELLGEIQRATNAAVLVTEEGSKGVESGTRQAAQAGQVIHRIALEVEGGAQANVQMAAAAQQQTAGVEQVGQAMEAIQQATTQALASTRQAERAARDLHTLAQSLQQTVATYRL